MNVNCEKCGKQYIIDETQLITPTSKATCKACGNDIIIHKPDSIAKQSVRPDSPAVNVAKKINWTSRIQVRIVSILILLTTLILFGYAAFNYYMEKNNMQKEIRLLTDITATRLSQQLVEPFWALDDTLLNKVVQSEMMNKEVYGILLRDRKGKDIYMGRKRNSNWEQEATKANIMDPSLVSKKVEIKRDKEVIGALEVYLTPRFMEQALQRSTIYMIITILVLDLILFFSIYTILSRSIIRPIVKLTEAAERISLGDLNLKLSAGANNEIGMLINAFQRMQSSLELAMKRLS